ncbi:MAG: murein L,D-transpeptidase [Rhodobacteraceae bacterium]|nr:MAG: murein L,D-transpeptidase [Paracoccaceae bacterium]
MACALATGAPRDAGAADAAPRLADSALAAVYAERANAPIWLAEDGARATALLDALRAAEDHALSARRYAPGRLESLLQAAQASGDPAAVTEAETAFTEAFLRYAADLGAGALEPRRVSADILVEPPRRSAPLLLRAMAAAENPAAHLAGLAPADPGYAALKRLFGDLRAKSGDAWGPPVAEGPSLREGDRGPRVAALRARLEAMGDALAPSDAPAVYDGALAAAVRAFQRRHGLNDDAVVGPLTLAALNVTPAARAAQVAVNMERMRWTNRPLDARRIDVNLADFSVTMWEDGAVRFHERAVVGMTSRQTPEFSDEMSYLVFNPTWHVPRSIAVRDLLPRLQADPAYLARSNMRLIGTDAFPAPADPSSHDFNAYTARDFPYRIRQNPDPDNALGRVKFMFPNNLAIYLHDTPSQRLFARDQRAYSSGCVRVRDPMTLAALLLAPQMNAPEEFIERVLASGRERYVNLDLRIPVHLTYRTAWIDDFGRPQFRADVYGRDALVLDALRALGVDAPET